MAKAISRTKAEIAAIKPDAGQHGKLGDVDRGTRTRSCCATESATSDILAAAEQLQEIAWTLARAGVRIRGLRSHRRQGDRCLHRLLVPGYHRPAHPQGHRRAALSRRPHQRDDRHLEPRWRDGGRRGRGRADGRRCGRAGCADEAEPRSCSGRCRQGDDGEPAKRSARAPAGIFRIPIGARLGAHGCGAEAQSAAAATRGRSRGRPGANARCQGRTGGASCLVDERGRGVPRHAARRPRRHGAGHRRAQRSARRAEQR